MLIERHKTQELTAGSAIQGGEASLRAMSLGSDQPLRGTEYESFFWALANSCSLHRAQSLAPLQMPHTSQRSQWAFSGLPLPLLS